MRRPLRESSVPQTFARGRILGVSRAPATPVDELAGATRAAAGLDQARCDFARSSLQVFGRYRHRLPQDGHDHAGTSRARWQLAPHRGQGGPELSGAPALAREEPARSGSACKSLGNSRITAISVLDLHRRGRRGAAARDDSGDSYLDPAAAGAAALPCSAGRVALQLVQLAFGQLQACPLCPQSRYRRSARHACPSRPCQSLATLIGSPRVLAGPREGKLMWRSRSQRRRDLPERIPQSLARAL